MIPRIHFMYKTCSAMQSNQFLLHTTVFVSLRSSFMICFPFSFPFPLSLRTVPPSCHCSHANSQYSHLDKMYKPLLLPLRHSYFIYSKVKNRQQKPKQCNPFTLPCPSCLIRVLYPFYSPRSHIVSKRRANMQKET